MHEFETVEKFACTDWKRVESSVKEDLDSGNYPSDPIGTEWYEIDLQELRDIIESNETYIDNVVDIEIETMSLFTP